MCTGTTKAQTSMRIGTVWREPLLFAPCIIHAACCNGCPKNRHVTACAKFRNGFSDLWRSRSAISYKCYYWPTILQLKYCAELPPTSTPNQTMPFFLLIVINLWYGAFSSTLGVSRLRKPLNWAQVTWHKHWNRL